MLQTYQISEISRCNLKTWSRCVPIPRKRSYITITCISFQNDSPLSLNQPFKPTFVTWDARVPPGTQLVTNDSAFNRVKSESRSRSPLLGQWSRHFLPESTKVARRAFSEYRRQLISLSRVTMMIDRRGEVVDHRKRRRRVVVVFGVISSGDRRDREIRCEHASRVHMHAFDCVPARGRYTGVKISVIETMPRMVCAFMRIGEWAWYALLTWIAVSIAAFSETYSLSWCSLKICRQMCSLYTVYCHK